MSTPEIAKHLLTVKKRLQTDKYSSKRPYKLVFLDIFEVKGDLWIVYLRCGQCSKLTIHPQTDKE